MIKSDVFHLEVLGPHVPESLAFRLFTLFISLPDEISADKNGKELPEDLMSLDVRISRLILSGFNCFLCCIQTRKLWRNRAGLLRVSENDQYWKNSCNKLGIKWIHFQRSRLKLHRMPDQLKWADGSQLLRENWVWPSTSNQERYSY